VPDDIGRERAAELVQRMRERFGWVVTVTERADVERQLGRELTGEEWRRVRESRWWANGVPDAMRNGAGDVLPTMLAALGIRRDEAS
jgi:hypothetical protein